MTDENYIQAFRQLGKKKPIPEDLKEEVMNSVDSMKFILDLADLFFVKPIEANIDMTNTFFED
ncbi:MAG: hypothetical protein R3E32_17080 [Chitinophagales bacterium]